jgi:hypothetical protein
MGENHLMTLNAASLLAPILNSKREYAEAEKLLVPIEAEMRKQFIGSYSFVRASYFLRRGVSRAGLHNYAAAEMDFLEAQSIAQTTKNITHADDLRDCAQALITLSTAWDRDAPGKGYDANAAQWKQKLAGLPRQGAVAPNQ